MIFLTMYGTKIQLLALLFIKVDVVPSTMVEGVTALDTRFIATVQMDGVEILLLIGMHREARLHGTANSQINIHTIGNCVWFEYGVSYCGGGGYKPRDCQPQSSSNTVGYN